MRHPAVAIGGYSEAAMLLRATPAPNIGAIISIHGVHEFGVEADIARRLDLSFDDVDVPIPGDVVSLQRAHARKRWAAQNGLIEVPPGADDAAAVIKFAESIRDVDGIVLCHCGGGMSRAPAAALICLAVWRGEGCESACADEIKRVRPSARPHFGLITFADELLGRNGKLIRAVAGAPG